MARVVFDPESETKVWRPIARLDMRSEALRRRHAAAERRNRDAQIRAAADRGRSFRRAMLVDMTAKIDVARRGLAEAGRDEAVAASAAELAKIVRQKIRTKRALLVATVLYRAVITFRVTREELSGAGKTQQISLARQFVMYWTLRLTKMSLTQVGRMLGDRHHTSVLHGEKAYRDKRRAMKRYLRPARAQ